MERWQQDICKTIDDHSSKLRDIRRYLHRNPEVSGRELETTKYVSEILKDAGIHCKTIPSQCGLMASGPTKNKPIIAMRADMDALQLQDKKQVDYASQVEGVHHACGHDAHTTMLIGACLALKANSSTLPYPVPWRALFQPAEETCTGAIEMIQHGALNDVTNIVALHVDPNFQVGEIGYRKGPLCAYCKEVHITIHGKGGHAARPHLAHDPIHAGAQFVSAVYQNIPRFMDSRLATVVSFGMFESGKTTNVIPEQAKLKGTLRALSHEDSAILERHINSIAKGIESVTGCRLEIDFRVSIPGVVNCASTTETCVQAAKVVVGDKGIKEIALPSMGGEDFSFYLEKISGCMLKLGTASSAATAHQAHTPLFDIDEDALAIGAKTLAISTVLLAEKLV